MLCCVVLNQAHAGHSHFTQLDREAANGELRWRGGDLVKNQAAPLKALLSEIRDFVTRALLDILALLREDVAHETSVLDLSCQAR
jgi:hypothetical protein